jgi:MerR family copper efflux transcriptional regulator
VSLQNLLDSILWYRVDNANSHAEEAMTIGRLASQAEVNVQTVRLYERLGLLKKPGRRASGYREYPDAAILSIRFIKQAKGLGFTLGEIKSLLDMREKGSHTIADMRAVAEARLDAIDEKIRQLQDMRDAIATGLSRCDCPEQFPSCVFVTLYDQIGSQGKEESCAIG